MLCPVDGETLAMTERNGVGIDYCPKCRGIWLDRGELDKILERAAPAAVPPVAQSEPRQDPYREPARAEPRSTEYRERYRDDDDDDDHRHGTRRKKRDSFLSDLFDF